MSPVKIHLLLNLHVSGIPLEQYTAAHAQSPAMREAYGYLIRTKLVKSGITFQELLNSRIKGTSVPINMLTEKGEDFVKQLKAIEP